ncbi:PKD domain-containing protein [Microbacterium sp. bgisy189]|uniref:PKD domain-containing protein n=1 Tax=Microbacterium sp. bgisy189 TaxID=3413798 RepID=UPI003EBC6CE1
MGRTAPRARPWRSNTSTRIAITVLSALSLIAAGLTVGAAPASAVATNTVAFYSMDEPAGATTLVDSSGNGRDGTIGSDVTTGQAFQGASMHRFATVLPGEMAYRPGHVNRVPHHSSLNPDAGDFSITLRFRTDYPFGNIAQKGQGTQQGGYWKVENPAGKPRCLFRGGNGASRTGYSQVEVDDGQWHVLRCVRTSAYVEMYIDGVRQSRLTGSTGSISNTALMSIGGKSSCNGTSTTCDYFVGDIDYLRIEKGASTSPNQTPSADVDVDCAGLMCALSGAASSDPDGAIQRYQWDFGDGTTHDGAAIPSTNHLYMHAGTYTIRLTVTDDRGATDQHAMAVTVTPAAETISYVGQATRNANASSHALTIPTNVRTGDTMLLFLSQNTSASRSTPAGWTQIDSIAGGYARTTVWRRVASATDAGSTVSVTLSSASKVNMVLAAYRGVSASDPIAGYAARTESASTNSRLTPTVNIEGNASWAVSYWMHGDAASSSLVAPGGVAVRSNGSQTGGGRVTGLLADSAMSVPRGQYGGLVATATAASTTTTSWTVVLAPQDGSPPANQQPVSAFVVDCSGLSCAVDGRDSSDAEGGLDFSWDWGDGSQSGAGAPPQMAHTYNTAGTYTVRLTVTDEDGATATTTRTANASTPQDESIEYVAAASSDRTSATHSLTVPAAVAAGDTLLLFLAVSGTPTVGAVSGGGTWEVLGMRDDGNLRTSVWRRTAGPDDAGSTVAVALGASAKGNLSLVVYRGAGEVAALASAAADGDSAQRATPSVAVSATNTWGVSYWAHRDSASAALDPPPTVASRATGTQSGGGRVTILVADSAASVPPGSYGGLAATADAASSYGVTWTIILAPPP